MREQVLFRDPHAGPRLDERNVCTGIAAMGSRLVNLCSGTTISFRETNV